MKDYYDVLDIPVTATLDEIKAQYKRLVRIYHPDRFVNPLDKVYAEHKLKELNEAYAVLSANAKMVDADEPTRPMPIPIVEPAVLEFGAIAVGQRHAVKFRVGNAGGPTKNISFVYNDDHAWYSIARVRQVYPDKAFPVEIDVILNSNQLEPSRKYQSWFDVNMDGATSRVALQLQTTNQAAPFRFYSQRLVLVTATCLLMIVLTLAIPWARSLGVAFGLPAVPPIVSSPFGEEQDVVGDHISKPYQEPIEWAPVFSPDHRQVAFVSDQLGASQIFIRDPLSGRLRQVTHDTEEKLALTWSPDGKRLAFITRDQGRIAVQVFTVDTDERARFTPKVELGEVTKLTWSPDSQSVLFDLLLQDERQFYQAHLKNQQVEQIPAPTNWQ